jgi:hypothetical protein
MQSIDYLRDTLVRSKLSIHPVRLGRFSVFYSENFARLNFGSAQLRLSSSALLSLPTGARIHGAGVGKLLSLPEM